MSASLGKYYDQAILGNTFILSTAAAGSAFPISTGTAATFGLWNTSTTHNAVLHKLNLGYTSGTIAIGEIGLANIAAPQFTVASGSNITAFTDSAVGVTYRNAIIGLGNSSRMRHTPSAATVAANTACWWSGYSCEIATAAPGVSVASIDIDGAVIVPPGQFVFVCGSIAQTGLFTMSLMWSEVSIATNA
jgi:hypothetical protein